MIARRWPRRLGYLLLCAAIAASLGGWLAVRQQIPRGEAPRLPGLSAALVVTFDARAVPTLQAASLLDASRALGLLHARERFFQMDLQRRSARGELAELLGKAALPSDRIHRVYGFAQVSEAGVAQLPPLERAHLEAYAAGVNAWLADRPHRSSLELALLGSPPRPWTAADSFATVLLMHEDLSSSWRSELRAEQLRTLPPAAQRFLMPRVTDRDVLLIPDLEPRPAADDSQLFKREHAGRTPARSPLPPDLLGLPADAGERPFPIGSNNWVIAGSRTRSGKPLLANDPHLGLRAPGIWYTARIEWAGRFVQGVTLPGSPGVIIGHNDRIAWGFTNIGTDVQDLYKEEPSSERREQIAVKGGPAEDFIVKIGVHGPQVRPGYSLHWAALDPRNLTVPLGIMEARDWDSFNAAFDRFTFAQNVVYADADGHIGWRATGLIPLRAPGDDGSLPMEGAGGAHDWRGFLPQAEMPRVLDPAQGYLVTANQRVIGTSFRHPVAARWASSSRARRIVELITQSRDKLSRQDVERMQLDVVSPALRDQARLWLALPGRGESIARLDGWDGGARAGDERMSIASALQAALRTELHLALLGKEGEDFEWINDDGALEAALREGQASWTRAGLGDKGALLLRAQARADKWLGEQPSRLWGEINRTQIHHPFGLRGGALGWLFDPRQAAQSGCGSCVRVGRPAHGQSMRMVVDLAEPEATTLVLPLGQSGHLGSPHRFDQQADWLDGATTGTLLKQPPQGSALVLTP